MIIFVGYKREPALPTKMRDLVNLTQTCWKYEIFGLIWLDLKKKSHYSTLKNNNFQGIYMEN